MEVLRGWLRELQLSRSVNNFEEDLSNGYVLGEVLHAYGLLPNLDMLVDRETPAAKVTNFTAIQQPLQDLSVKFNSKIANEIMTERKGVAVNLCYQLKLAIESRKQGSYGAKPVTRRGTNEPVLLGSSLRTNRKALSKYEAMQTEHFESLVRQQVQDPKRISEALTLSKFTESMIMQQQEAEDLDQLRQENWRATIQQQRQLHLSKMREGKRLMNEWQAEGYEKHRINLERRADDEKMKLRFELSIRNKRMNAIASANAASANELVSGVDEFEKSLQKLKDGGDDEEDTPFHGEAIGRMDLSAEEHLSKMERMLPDPKLMDSEARTYVDRLRARRLEEEASRKEREMRRRKVILEQEQAQAQLEEKRREELLLAKLSRQCVEERKISEQVWQVRKEKELMRQHREARDRELEEQRQQEERARIERNRQLGADALAEYQAKLVTERKVAEQLAAEREERKRAKHEAICRSITMELVALASRVADFRATTQPLLPPKVLRDWLTLFQNGVSLIEPGFDTPHAEEQAPTSNGGGEDARLAFDSVVSTVDFDDYLTCRVDWSRDKLSSVALPSNLTGPLTDPDSLAPLPVEQGCAHTGRMVLELVDIAEPPPPPSNGLGLDSSLIKLAILGRPFSGKSLLAQRLAESHQLHVIMPSELVQQAVVVADRWNETKLDEAAREPSELEKADKEQEPPDLVVLGQRLKEALALKDKKGEPIPIPDNMLVELVTYAMRNVDPLVYSGFILDDFPRTASQAALLEKILTGYEAPPKEPAKKKAAGAAQSAELPARIDHVPGLDFVLRLDVSDECVRKRAFGRRLDPETGVIYHLEFEPPPEDGLLNERLVPVEGIENAQSQLPRALMAYTEKEAALAEWFTDLGLLQQVNAEMPITNTFEAVETIFLNQSKAKSDREEKNAARAETPQPTSATEESMDEEESPEENNAVPDAVVVEAAPREVPSDAAVPLLSHWRTMETEFLSKGRTALATLRELQWQALQRICRSRKEFVALLNMPDLRQAEVYDAQQRFNAMPTDLRFKETGKNELHMIVSDMQERLWALSDEKRSAAERMLSAMADDGWLSAHGLQIAIALLSLCQVEADRFVRTCGLVNTFSAIRCEHSLAYEPPSLFDVPIPDTVDLSVPLPGMSDAPTETKPTKGKPEATSAGKTIPAILLSAAETLNNALCTPLEVPAPLEVPPELATAEVQRATSWNSFLQQAVVGERAKLRRRLVSVLRYSGAFVSDLKAQLAELYSQLDQWMGERIKKESEAINAVVAIMRKAIETEEKLSQALQLQGSGLVIDESLLMLPPPVPPPAPPPGQAAIPDRFTVVQLGNLACRLRAAASGETISVDVFKHTMCRLSLASFDTSQLPLPKDWLPLGSPAYHRLGEKFCMADSNLFGWPELIVSLACLEAISEKAILEILRAAASIAGRSDLLAEPPTGNGSTRVGLKLSREQMTQLPLWFETGEIQADGYSVEVAMKNVLFEMLERNGEIDIQQLLLYCCDTPAKAFVVLGFQTQSMLSIEGLYELLHREPRDHATDFPEHADVFSRTTLRRLFVQLKLGDAERAPYSLVAAHPVGAQLLARCKSFTPKDPYEVVAAELASAGEALKI